MHHRADAQSLGAEMTAIVDSALRRLRRAAGRRSARLGSDRAVAAGRRRGGPLPTAASIMMADEAWCAIGDLRLRADAGAAVVDTLHPLAERCEAVRVHCIGHAHIDLSYLWAHEDARRVFLRDLPTVVQLMDDYPELRFTHSQPAGYEILRGEDPPTFARIRELVAAGQWEPATAQLVESDTPCWPGSRCCASSTRACDGPATTSVSAHR